MRSARDTSSGKVRTCIFSITLWRWALMVRSVQPNARATCLLGLPRMTSQKDFPLARRQCRDMSADHVQFALQTAHLFMTRNRARNCPKKVVRRYGLGQNVIRTRLDGLDCGPDVKIAGEEYDRQRRTSSLRRFCSAGPSHSRYSHVEEDTARLTFARQADQQMQGRSIGRDLVTGVFQTTFIAVRNDASSSTICTHPCIDRLSSTEGCQEKQAIATLARHRRAMAKVRLSHQVGEPFDIA